MTIFSRLKKFVSSFFLHPAGSKKENVSSKIPAAATGELNESLLARQFAAFSGYHFRNSSWLVQALKHRSFLNLTAEKRNHSYERLEFLGDAVLNLIATELLFFRFPDQNEGTMTQEKAALVNQRVLAEKAKKMKLDQLILISESEEKIGGRQRASILADALESVLGAIFIDGGYAACREIALRWIYHDIDAILKDHQSINYKGMLLEYTQGQHIGVPFYQVIEEKGPEHHKKFTVQVLVQHIPYGIGEGYSKKQAEQQAAFEALLKLKLISS